MPHCNRITTCLLVFAALMLPSAPALAVPYTWDFAANASCAAVPSTPVSLCDSDYNANHLTFADGTNTYSIVARGYNLGTGTSPTTLVIGTTTWTIAPMSPNDDLYAKFNGDNEGEDETGLGLSSPDLGGAHEIEKNNFIQLDLTGLPASTQSVDLLISSLQTGETATVWGSSTLGQPGLLLASFVGPGAGGSAVMSFHYDLSAGRYLTVSANPNFPLPNDVLIESGFTADIPLPTTTTTSSTSSTSSSTSTTHTTSTSTSSSSSSTSSTTSSSTTSTSTTLPPFDHFQCYEIKPATTPATTVSVDDRFETVSETVRYPHRFCVPVDKNGEGIVDATQSLIGYVMNRPVFKSTDAFTVTNQFGTIALRLARPNVLMVPSTVSLAGPPAPTPPTIDHFQCYKAKRARGGAKFTKVTVTIADQLESQTLTVVRPELLCAPADKNGEDATAPAHAVHLVCYKVLGQPFGTSQGNFANQFGTDDGTLIHRRELCLPSSVQ